MLNEYTAIVFPDELYFWHGTCFEKFRQRSSNGMKADKKKGEGEMRRVLTFKRIGLLFLLLGLSLVFIGCQLSEIFSKNDEAINVLKDGSASQELHKLVTESLKQTVTEKDMPALVEIMLNTELDHMPDCLRQLISKGGAAAVRQIRMNLDSAKPTSKIYMIRSLGQIPGEGSFDVLNDQYARISKDDIDTKKEVLQAMGELKNERTIPIFERAFWESDSIELKKQALSLLGQMERGNVVPLATRALTLETDREIRLEAIELLRKYGTLSEKHVLVALKMNGRDPEMQQGIDSAIGAIEKRGN